jgi:polar amino acid transport system permease protein
LESNLNQDLQDFLPLLARGLETTLAITICALALSIVLGFLWAWMGISRVAALRWISRR